MNIIAFTPIVHVLGGVLCSKVKNKMERVEMGNEEEVWKSVGGMVRVRHHKISQTIIWDY